jgi:hypothetical protein
MLNEHVDPTCFHFEQDFVTKQAIAERLGRLVLGDGTNLQLFFAHDGLHVFISHAQSAHVHLNSGYSDELRIPE